MSVNTIEYSANQPTTSAQGTSNTERGPSENLWGWTPLNGGISDFIQDPRLGMHFFDDFLMVGTFPAAATSYNSSVGQWSVFQGSNGGNITNASSIAGILQFLPCSQASSSQASGVSTPANTLQGNIGAFQFMLNSSGNSALNGRMVFECRVMLTSITSAARAAFVGLTDGVTGSNNPFLYAQGGTSNDLFSSATTDHALIGFVNPSSGLGQDWAFVYKVAASAPVFASNLRSLVSNVLGTAISAGTWYKLGFIYDPQAPPATIATASDGQTVGNVAKKMIRIFVNGVEATPFLTQTQNILTSSFPSTPLFPIASFMYVGTNSGASASATSNAGVMNLDWMRVAQNLIA